MKQYLIIFISRFLDILQSLRNNSTIFPQPDFYIRDMECCGSSNFRKELHQGIIFGVSVCNKKTASFPIISVRNGIFLITITMKTVSINKNTTHTHNVLPHFLFITHNYFHNICFSSFILPLLQCFLINSLQIFLQKLNLYHRPFYNQSVHRQAILQNNHQYTYLYL